MNRTVLTGICTLAIIGQSLPAAVSHTENFANGPGFFTALQTTAITTTNEALSFRSNSSTVGNQQGSGVTLDLNQDGVLGSSFSNLAAGTLFFRLDVTVPTVLPNVQVDAGFFFGPAVTRAQASSVENAQNNSGFAFFFNDGDLIARSSSAPGNNITVLSNLGIGSSTTIDIEWRVSNGQNPGQFNNDFTLTASGLGANGQAVGNSISTTSAINRSASEIDAFQFGATASRGLSGTINSFAVSDTAFLAAVPEPSSALLLLIGTAGLLRRRR